MRTVLNRLDLRAIEGDVTTHLPRPEVASDGPVAAVRSILAAVRADGDAALHRYTKEFDGIDLDTLRVDPAEIAAALERSPADVRDALYVAAGRIEAFHRTQLHEPTSYVDGGTIRSFAVPVDRAGCYVPGGRAAYPSTVLMTAIPAKVAGVGQVVVCVPPDRTTGAIVDVTLAACAVAGVDEVYAIGGAQAIGALAYGTESVAKVDVICGPGNKYVAIAKREVSVNVHFIPLPKLSLYEGLGYRMVDHPNTYKLYSTEISLPVYYDLSDAQVDTVVAAVKAAVTEVLG